MKGETRLPAGREKRRMASFGYRFALSMRFIRGIERKKRAKSDEYTFVVLFCYDSFAAQCVIIETWKSGKSRMRL